MFFKITDKKGDVGYINISLVEFIRPHLDGSVEIYNINNKTPIRITSESAKPILKYIEGFSNVN